MKSSRRARRDRRVILIVLVVSCVVSAFFGRRIAPAGSPDVVSALQGATNAVLVAAPILFLEIYGIQSALGERMLRLPLPAYLGVKMLFYAVVILGGQILSRTIFLVLFGQPLRFDGMFTSSLIFGGMMAVMFNFTFEMGALLGFGTQNRCVSCQLALPQRSTAPTM